MLIYAQPSKPSARSICTVNDISGENWGFCIDNPDGPGKICDEEYVANAERCDGDFLYTPPDTTIIPPLL